MPHPAEQTSLVHSLGYMNRHIRAGARRFYLETNHALTPAIRLYESVGFKHIDPSRIVPSPYERADVYMELFLV
jgi:ribosomal protein S18 acetylase RimI-like enzyme